MAVTLVGRQQHSVGDLKCVVVDVDGPASYVADGQTVTVQDLGLKYIVSAQAGGSDNGDQFCAASHLANKGFPATSIKVAWFVNTTGAEVANAVDLSARNVRVTVLGY